MSCKKKYGAFLFLIFGLVLHTVSYAQPNRAFKTFRIQHKKFHFYQYPTKKYTVYIEQDADSIARTVIENTTSIITSLEDSLQQQVSKHLHIIIYNGEANHLQTNIGQQFEEVNAGGTIQFTNNRIVIPFTGKQEQLLQDIRYELCRHIIYKMLYGTKVDEVLLQLGKSSSPSWFVESIISFYAKGFTCEEDNLLKHYLLSNKAKTFNECLTWNSQIAGKALLYYLDLTYGKFTLGGLLYQLTSKKDLNKAIQVTYKKPLGYLMQSTLAFFAQRYIRDNLGQDSTIQIAHLDRKNQKGTTIIPDQLYFTSDGAGLVYLSMNEVTYQLWWEEINPRTNKPQKILLSSFKKDGQTQSPPIIITKNQKNNHLCIINTEEGQLLLYEWQLSSKGNLSHKTTRYVHGLDGVINGCYGRTDNTIYLSAYRDGQTDLYEYTISTGKLEQITHDTYDENTPSMFNNNGSQGLLFTSNHPSDTIPTLNAKHIHKSVNETLHFMTLSQMENLKNGNPFQEGSEKTFNTTFLDQQKVRKISTDSEGTIYLLSDKNGIQNLFTTSIIENKFDTVHPLTNGEYSLSNYYVDNGSLMVGSLINDSISISQLPLKNEKSANRSTILQNEIHTHNVKVDSLRQQEKSKKRGEPTFPFFKADSTEVDLYQKETMKEKTYQESLLEPYRLQLTSEYVVAQLDNTLLINSYQPYTMNQGLFRQAPIGGMLIYAFTDLFENHRVNLGFRIPSTTKGSDFYLTYTSVKNRLDWNFTYFRHVEKFTFNPNPKWFTSGGYFFPPYIKQKTHYGELQTTYPFSKKSAVSALLGLRYDKQIFLATDTTSLRFPDTSQVWSMAKVEYQIDKTTQPIPYARTGFRAKVFIEYQYQIKEVSNSFVHVGLDIRQYQPLYKHIVFANKVCAAISGGETNGMLYVLGGTSNWLAPRTDTSVHFLPTDNYSFISYANNLRGYAQNIRTGNTYVLLNSEVRIPLLNTFYDRYTSLNSLNNLQFVPFLDIGNAWTPSLNKTIPKWAIGYGFGLRTTLLNYFVRADLAWQNLPQTNQKRPMVVIGMGREY